MWLFVFFDLPTTTKKERHDAALFRKNLERDGFTMMQFSVYVRHCGSYESMEVHVNRVKTFVPQYGAVSILSVTDKQYSKIFNFRGLSGNYKSTKKKKIISEPMQLEFFSMFAREHIAYIPFFYYSNAAASVYLKGLS